MENTKISFVIPCYKSEHTIETVVEEVVGICDQLGYQYEIITVNDCSPDNLLSKLMGMAEKNDSIKVIDLAKNFGQHSAMMAGANCSSGGYVVFLDDDGQCPVKELDRMLKPLIDGEADITIARYGKKEQSAFKNLCSNINEFVAKVMIDKPSDIQLGNFIAIKRYVVDEMCKYTGSYPYISGLLIRSSGRIKNVQMRERKRLRGGTTYTISKLFSLWINSFTAFSIKPLRFATMLGCFVALSGFIYGLVIIVRYMFSSITVDGWCSIMVVLLVVGGMILIVLGIIGEYIGRIYMCISNKPQYVIRSTYNIQEEV